MHMNHQNGRQDFTLVLSKNRKIGYKDYDNSLKMFDHYISV